MRLKRSRLKKCYHRQAIPKKDKEGGSYVEFGSAMPFQAEEWPAGGKVQTEMYGLRLPGIRNLRMGGNYTEVSAGGRRVGYQIEGGPLFCAGDGICLFVSPDSEPDYKIIAIYPHRFLTLEVEKRE